MARFPLIVGAVLLALAVWPHAAGYLSRPAGQAFLGFVENAGDANPYVSWVRQAAEGRVFIESRYSPEPVGAHLFNLMTFLLGNVSRLTGLSPMVVYQGSRILFGALLLAVIWWACGQFAPRPRTRRFAFAWIACGAGVGWVFALVPALRGLVPSRPGDLVDLAIPEAYTFYSIFVFPHLAASAALLVAALAGYWRAVRDGRAARAAWPAVAVLALGFFHPYPLLVAGGVVGAHALLSLLTGRGSRAVVVSACAVLAAVAAGLGWNLYMFSRDAVLAGWRAQNITLSGNVVWYLLAYGLAGGLVPVSLAWFWRRGLREELRGRGPAAGPEGKRRGAGARAAGPGPRAEGAGDLGGLVFLAVWILVNVLLLYAPVPFQRRLVEGFQVPVVLVAALGVAGWLETRWEGSARARVRALAVMTALVVVSAPSTGLVVARGLERAKSGDPALFASREELAALAWLDGHARPGSVVLASWETGNRIPRFTDCRVFAGHTTQTLDFAAKNALAEGFFRDPITPEQRAGFLAHFGIEWLFAGPRERALGPFDPAASPLFAQAFRAGPVAVYAVRRP